jgi:hypothetical protein
MYPVVQVVNSDDEAETPTNISFDTTDQLTITFETAKTGYASCVTGGGEQGPAGTSGVAGTSGTSGSSGTSGEGTSGTSGTSGEGTSGTSGTSGIQGPSGDAGTSGTSGTSGVDGTSGSSGTSGNASLAGDQSGDINTSEYSLIHDVAPTADVKGYGDVISVTVDTNAFGVGAALMILSDGNWDTCDADAAATMPCRALALETGTGTKKILLRGVIRVDAWNWTVGGLIYASTSVGELTQTAPSGTGDIVQIVGYALTADVMYFNPDYTYVELV